MVLNTAALAIVPMDDEFKSISHLPEYSKERWAAIGVVMADKERLLDLVVGAGARTCYARHIGMDQDSTPKDIDGIDVYTNTLDYLKRQFLDLMAEQLVKYFTDGVGTVDDLDGYFDGLDAFIDCRLDAIADELMVLANPG